MDRISTAVLSEREKSYGLSNASHVATMEELASPDVAVEESQGEQQRGFGMRVSKEKEKQFCLSAASFSFWSFFMSYFCNLKWPSGEPSGCCTLAGVSFSA